MKCFLDLDGVLVDFVGGVCKLHNIPDPYLDPVNYGVWGFAGVAGMSNNQFWDSLTLDFWENLEWTHDGAAILHLCELAYGEHNICILTSPPASRQDEAITGKMRWINKHLPQYARRLLVGPAKEFCASPTSVLVDDYDENIKKFNASGGRGYLYPRLWNSKHVEAANALEVFRRCV
jgi:hypothetical protein